MTGGKGADEFQFSDPPIAHGNTDRITDFDPVHDRINLGIFGFDQLGLGALTEAEFGRGRPAATPGQRILYGSATGFVFYDADGSDVTKAVHFATVDPGTLLTAHDFMVI